MATHARSVSGGIIYDNFESVSRENVNYYQPMATITRAPSRVSNSAAQVVVRRSALVFPDLSIQYQAGTNDFSTIDVPILTEPLVNFGEPPPVRFDRLRFIHHPDFDVRFDLYHGVTEISSQLRTFLQEGINMTDYNRELIMESLSNSVVEAAYSYVERNLRPTEPVQCDFEILRARIERIGLRLAQ
jgi:hypothetical protein